MEREGLIPEGFEGKFNSYLTREDFYLLSLNLIKAKLGEEEFYNYFNFSQFENDISLDPIKGEIIVDEIPNNYYNLELCNNKKEMYEAYKVGLIHDLNDVKFNPDENISRLDAIKISAFICEKFGVDVVANNKEINLIDLSLLSDYEKLCVYFAINKGLLLGDGKRLKPYEYCTYQEAFILMDRVYKVIN